MVISHIAPTVVAGDGDLEANCVSEESTTIKLTVMAVVVVFMVLLVDVLVDGRMIHWLLLDVNTEIEIKWLR